MPKPFYLRFIKFPVGITVISVSLFVLPRQSLAVMTVPLGGDCLAFARHDTPFISSRARAIDRGCLLRILCRISVSLRFWHNYHNGNVFIPAGHVLLLSYPRRLAIWLVCRPVSFAFCVSCCECSPAARWLAIRKAPTARMFRLFSIALYPPATSPASPGDNNPPCRPFYENARTPF